MLSERIKGTEGSTERERNAESETESETFRMFL